MCLCFICNKQILLLELGPCKILGTISLRQRTHAYAQPGDTDAKGWSHLYMGARQLHTDSAVHKDLGMPFNGTASLLKSTILHMHCEKMP